MLECVSDVDELRAQAAEIAARNTPLRVADTIMLGILTFTGWIIGRAWFFIAATASFWALAIRHGYRKGARVQTAPRPQAARDGEQRTMVPGGIGIAEPGA